MARIALSYRRADSSAMTGRIFDRLVDRYGAESVFMDIDNIPYGSDYRQHIRDALSGIDVLLVIIGPNWLGRLPDSSTRIHEEDDLVRIEVEIALQRQIPVIPVLVLGGGMPSAQELPESVRRFAFHHAAEVDDGRDFRVHMDRLLSATDAMLARKAPPPLPRPEPRPTPRRPDEAPPAEATATGLWRHPLAAVALAAVLTLGYFVLALSDAFGAFGTVLFALLSILAPALAGYIIHRRMGSLGGAAALVGALAALITMAVAWVYQLVDLRAGLPVLTFDDNDSILMPVVKYVLGATLAAVAGNLLSQLRTPAESALPLGRLARLVPSRSDSGTAWTARRLVIALAIAAAALGAVWAGYEAWFPYCRGFLLYEFCTI